MPCLDLCSSSIDGVEGVDSCESCDFKGVEAQPSNHGQSRASRTSIGPAAGNFATLQTRDAAHEAMVEQSDMGRYIPTSGIRFRLNGWGWRPRTPSRLHLDPIGAWRELQDGSATRRGAWVARA